MEQQSIRFSFRARYVQSGPVSEKTSEIWFVLHGYGQLATFFSKKFNAVAARNCVIIAPEGLSRFYLEDVQQRAQGKPSRIGASWMTREDRQTDIENYLSYLNSVYREVVPAAFKGKISVLGFSQGAATATRWVMSEVIDFHRLILWAGVFPDDLDFEAARAVLATKKTVMVRGTEDPFITDERLAESSRFIDRLKLTPQLITFPGGHEIQEAALLSLLD